MYFFLRAVATPLAFVGWILFQLLAKKKKFSEIEGDVKVIAFFLAEMGDTTQLATMALAARFQSMAWVTAGSTLGMLFTNGLTVFFGERILEIVPMKYVRWVASLLFFGFGLAILFG